FWSVAWALIFILPVPILTHSPLGRVYYPGLPAVYILIAIGLYIFTRESLRALGSALTPLVTAVCVTFLVWIPLFNFYIYFNEVDDFEDRQMRREVAEMAKEAASEDNFLALVSVPRANEALNNEFQMIELFMLEKLPIEQIASSYKNVAIEDVLPNLANLSDRPKRSILFDNKTTIERSKRDTLMNAIKMCYPDAHWETGNFFSRADLTADMLANPNCTSATLTLENKSPSLFEWNLSAGSASKLTLTCEQFVSERVWIEAETLNLHPGWQTETAFAQNWGGDGFLMDNFGSLPMLFDIESAEGKPIYLWVRYYKRTVDDYPAQITLNGKTYSFDRAGEENLNQWVWERLGPFETQPGTNTAGLNRPYTGNPQEFMAIFIDTFVISSSADFSPTGSNSLRLPVKTFSFPETLSRGNIVFQLEPGSYRCYAEAENEKKPIMDSLGITPVRSNEIELKILP
ncbi:MAG: hypothetical protein HXY38_11030, partial [Chloroflexi bacterium]|nr:hypothetical protein [Chloroflexota bacterium]